MCFFFSLIPATIFVLLGYFVLVSSRKAESNIGKFGLILAIWLFIVALFFLQFIIFNAINFFNPELVLEQSHLTEWLLFSVLMFWIIEHEVSMTKDKKDILRQS